MFSLNCLVCVEEINLSFVSFEDISIEDQKTLISLGYSPALDWEYMTERSIACDLQDDPTEEEIEAWRNEQYPESEDEKEQTYLNRLAFWSKCYDDLHDPDSIDTEDPRF